MDRHGQITNTLIFGSDKLGKERSLSLEKYYSVESINAVTFFPYIKILENSYTTPIGKHRSVVSPVTFQYKKLVKIIVYFHYLLRNTNIYP